MYFPVTPKIARDDESSFVYQNFEPHSPAQLFYAVKYCKGVDYTNPDQQFLMVDHMVSNTKLITVMQLEGLYQYLRAGFNDLSSLPERVFGFHHMHLMLISPKAIPDPRVSSIYTQRLLSMYGEIDSFYKKDDSRDQFKWNNLIIKLANLNSKDGDISSFNEAKKLHAKHECSLECFYEEAKNKLISDLSERCKALTPSLMDSSLSMG